MLKKFLRPTIIVAAQVILLLILMTFLTPLLIKNSSSLIRFHQLLQNYKWFFLIIHGIGYMALYFFWPFLIQLIVRKQITMPDEGQLTQALNARLYLIGLFVLFELLHLLR